MDNKSSKNSFNISIKHIDFQSSIKHFLKAMGEDLDRQGLKLTPERFEKSFKYLLSGYDRKFEDEIRSFENKSKYKGIIILKNIDFLSVCEHHLLPFFGFAHVAYIPSETKYLGISKLARVVDIYSKRLQDQENLSFQVAQALMTHAEAKGVAVLIEARHLCNVARGIEKKVSIMTTCDFYGSFENDINLQNKFMELVKDRAQI